jgi:hypothetical protein
MFLNDMVFLRLVSIELFGGHVYLYRLSGRGMRLGLGAKSSGATLFNFFIRRRTRSQRCMEEIIYFLLLLTPPVVPNCSFWLTATSWSHLDSRQLVAVARNFWSVKRHRVVFEGGRRHCMEHVLVRSRQPELNKRLEGYGIAKLH